MPLEERAKAGKNGLDLFFRHNREDHFEALLFAEHEMRLPHTMMTLSKNVADDRVAGGLDSVQQLGHECAML